MTRRTRRLLGWSAFTAAWLVGLLLVLGRPTHSRPTRSLPEPNGYDDFVSAVKLLRGSLPNDRQPSPDEASAYLATNLLALESIRAGLSRLVAAPPLNQKDLDTRVEQTGRFKSLARLLTLDADLARTSGDWDRFVAASSNSFAFALHLSRGGVVIDDMIALSAENLARSSLEKALPDIPSVQARRAARAIADLDATRVSFNEVKAEEEYFVRSSQGLVGRAAWVLVLRSRAQAGLPRIEQKRNASILATRQLALRLAMSAYHQERVEALSSAQDLVPDFLPRRLEDPASGAPLDLPRSDQTSPSREPRKAG